MLVRYARLLLVIQAKSEAVSKRRQRPLGGIGFGCLDRQIMGVSRVARGARTATSPFARDYLFSRPHPDPYPN